MTDTPIRRRLLRAILRIAAVLVLITAGLAFGIGYRLTRGPLALPDWAVAQIEARIDRGVASAGISISDVALDYDLAAQALQLRVRDARIRDGEAEVLILPEARVSLDGASLLSGHLRPRSVDLDGVALDIGRDADGRFSLSLGAGGGGGLPRDPAAVLAALDVVLAAPVIAGLDAVRISGLTLRARDAITGIEQDISDGQITLERLETGARLTLMIRLPVGAGRVSELAVTLVRGGDAPGARASISLDDLPLAYLGQSLPGVPALSLATGSASASAQMSLAEDGTPGPLSGRVILRDLRSVDHPAFAFDRSALAFDWLPGSDRIALTEISAGSDAFAMAAAGQILLEDGLTGPVQVQLRLAESILNPEGMFESRVAFDQGLIEARLTQAPLALNLGQAMLTGPSGTARVSGHVSFAEAGLSGGLDLSVPRLPVEQLKRLWPPKVQVQARTWVVDNMIGGLASDVTAALRLSPGTPPQVLANFNFQGGQVRYMRFMPMAEDARGAAQFDGKRLALRVDAASVPAINLDDAVTDATPRVHIGGTYFVLPDVTARPIRGELTLQAEGAIGDVLTLINNRPLRILDRLKKDNTLASGRGAAQVRVSLPLRKGNAPADIDWDIVATLQDVTSNAIVPGRTIRAARLALTASPEAVEIGGDLTFDGVRFNGSWRQALPPRSTEAIDPDAPPPPPVPLPEAGRVTGVAQVSPDDLARLGIRVAALDLRGQAQADLSVRLPQGAPPELSLRSRLDGLAVALPAVSWNKPAGRSADFTLEARLGPVPEVTRIALDAPGLTANGQIRFRTGGGLEQARFDAVDIGWFKGPLTLTGRGTGASPEIAIGGGTADLRRALLGQRGGGAGDSGGSPLSIVLNRLTVTEGIALTDLRATLRGSSGAFSGRLNGGAQVEGVLAPGSSGGTSVQISGADAGDVLRSSGLFKDARGGVIQLTLQPTGQAGTYDGALRISNLRIRNAPALASLLQALSVVGILEQLDGEGLSFQSVESDFTLRPGDIRISRASAVGPSMSITADGVYDLGSKMMDLQGVVSPIYLVNGLFGALFSRRDEGLFGFTYSLKGLASKPQVSVNPLSILTPGIFREIFRSPPPDG